MRQGQQLSLKNWQLSGGTLVRTFAPPVLTIGLIALFWDRFAAIDLSHALEALARITLPQWSAALVLSAVSYWALGRYDASCHRMLKTGVPHRVAARTGAAAFAVSQTLGLGVVTGAIARWRLLPDLKPAQALALSSFCALSFMAIWGGLALGIVGSGLVPGVGSWWMPGAAQTATLTLAAAAIALAISPSGWPRRARLFLRHRGIGLRSLAGLAVYAAIDMLAAAGVLVILLDQSISSTQVAAVFVLALGAGLLSSTPSGLGAFELTMLALLPQADPATLLAAITGYRLIYFTIPALVGLVTLAHPPLISPKSDRSATGWEQSNDHGPVSSKFEHLMSGAPFAEARLAMQPGLQMLWSHRFECGGVFGATGKSLVMVRDPFPTEHSGTVLDGFIRYARDHGRTACLYKCSARTAMLARKRGYHVMRVGHEAWIDPATYDVATRSRRQLRRKLRQVEKAGIRFEHCAPELLPFQEMTRLNTAWVKAHGGERGFSMGRFFPDLLGAQRVYLAWDGSTLVGFVSFHQVEAEWSLDLLRPAPGAADGIAHGLINFAIQEAAAHRVPRISLAAAPRDQSGERDLGESPLDHLKRRIAQQSGGSGLARFKSMFAPNWQPLYIAAPTRRALLRAGLEIGRAISVPLPRS